MGESPGDTSLSPCSVLSPSPCRSMSAQLILSPHRHVQVTTGRSFLKHYRSVTQTKQPAAGPCSHKTTSFTFTRQDQSLHAHKSMTYILIPYACVCVCARANGFVLSDQHPLANLVARGRVSELCGPPVSRQPRPWEGSQESSRGNTAHLSTTDTGLEEEALFCAV